MRERERERDESSISKSQTQIGFSFVGLNKQVVVQVEKNLTKTIFISLDFLGLYFRISFLGQKIGTYMSKNTKITLKS